MWRRGESDQTSKSIHIKGNDRCPLFFWFCMLENTRQIMTSQCEFYFFLGETPLSSVLSGFFDMRSFPPSEFIDPTTLSEESPPPVKNA